MQRSFSVYVEFDTTDVSPDTYADLFDTLHDVDGAAGPASNGNLSVRLTIEADSVRQAIARGIEHAQAAATAHDITPTVTAVEAVTETERDRRLTDEDQEEEPRETALGARSTLGPFSVYVEFDETETCSDTYADLVDALHDVEGAAGPASNGNLSVRLTIRAGSIMQAVALGIEHAQAASAALDITPVVIGFKGAITTEHPR
ncbi:hypothetical protein ABZ851_30580 [Streptomyces sp. NPDC047049]|uniref:hypothetical protein n=1 Tax=Streptomyces sp. NPDC047049 TaxID=3156688 RepID=UPI0033D78409